MSKLDLEELDLFTIRDDWMLHLPWPRKLRLLFAIVVPWKWTPFVINETIYEFIDYIYCFSNRHKLLRCGSRAMFVRPFWARGLLWSGIRREASREDVCTCQCYCSYQVGLLFQIKEIVINNKLIDSLVSTSINFLSTPTF